MDITKPGRARAWRGVARQAADGPLIAGAGASTADPASRESAVCKLPCGPGDGTAPHSPGSADGDARSHAHARRATGGNLSIQLMYLCGTVPLGVRGALMECPGGAPECFLTCAAGATHPVSAHRHGGRAGLPLPGALALLRLRIASQGRPGTRLD